MDSSKRKSIRFISVSLGVASGLLGVARFARADACSDPYSNVTCGTRPPPDPYSPPGPMGGWGSSGSGSFPEAEAYPIAGAPPPRAENCTRTYTDGRAPTSRDSPESERLEAAQLAYSDARARAGASASTVFPGGAVFRVTYPGDGSQQEWTVSPSNPSRLSNVPRTQPTPANQTLRAQCRPT
jgi:hypothetical protein